MASIVRPDVQHQVAEETTEYRAANETRRDHVLKHPEIAKRLCDPPYSAPSPEFWTGYIPPAYHQNKPNDSPVRRQLMAICKAVEAKEEREANPDMPALADEKALQILHINLDAYGITERHKKLLYLTGETNRTITSSKDLYHDEAWAIIKRLTALVNAQKETEDESSSNPEGRAVDGGRDDHYDRSEVLGG